MLSTTDRIKFVPIKCYVSFAYKVTHCVYIIDSRTFLVVVHSFTTDILFLVTTHRT